MINDNSIRDRNGFILIELLIVLMVIGILIAGAVRTWDVSISQSRFNQTEKEMQQLAYAISGNPELYTEGKRTDFGYVGDMGKLPDRLVDLVVPPTDPNTNWKGPYIKVKFAENPNDYLQSAWGDTYVYNKDSLYIRSYTSGSILTPQTWINRRIAQSEALLLNNVVAGRVLDLIGDPPGASNDTFIRVFIIHPLDGVLETLPPLGQITTNGEYTITNVSQGNYKMFVTYMPSPTVADTVGKYICVYPGIANTADFRLTVKFQ